MVTPLSGVKLILLRDFYRPCHVIPVADKRSLIFNQYIDRDMFEMMQYLRKQIEE